MVFNEKKVYDFIMLGYSNRKSLLIKHIFFPVGACSWRHLGMI